MSKLSRLLRKVGPVATLAAPILGTAGLGTAAAISGLVGRFGAQEAPAAPVFAPAAFSPMAAMGAAAPAMRMAAAAGGAMLGVARTLGGKIKGVWLSLATGGAKFINRKKAVALAKRVGLDAAALALGISAVEMSEMILDESAAPRRGKGITARNIRTTKRVIGQVQRIHCQLGLKRGGMPRRACA